MFQKFFKPFGILSKVEGSTVKKAEKIAIFLLVTLLCYFGKT
jgi:hypothetical protein